MGFTHWFLPLLCPSGGFRVIDVPQSEGDALVWLYKHTNGPNWTNHTNWLQTHTVGNWFGITVAGGHVTKMELQGNGLNGNIAALPLGSLPSLIWLYLHNNAALSGNISGWTFPAPLVQLYLSNDAGITGDLSGWTLTPALSIVNLAASGVSGNIGGWTLPATLTQLYLNTTALSGNISGWTLPALMTVLYLHATTTSGTPDISGNTKMTAYWYQDCALTQANVNAILLSVYNRRMAFTFATPVLNVGGTNTAPSGLYQAGCPPMTGKEYAFELVNDSCLDGFIKWAVTFTP